MAQDTGGRSLLVFRKLCSKADQEFLPVPSVIPAFEVGFCVVSVVFSLLQTILAHSEGIRMDESLPVGELTGTTPCFSKQEKKYPILPKQKHGESGNMLSSIGYIR